jgi:hypothetical protein
MILLIPCIVELSSYNSIICTILLLPLIRKKSQTVHFAKKSPHGSCCLNPSSTPPSWPNPPLTCTPARYAHARALSAPLALSPIPPCSPHLAADFPRVATRTTSPAQAPPPPRIPWYKTPETSPSRQTLDHQDTGKRRGVVPSCSGRYSSIPISGWPSSGAPSPRPASGTTDDCRLRRKSRGAKSVAVETLFF